MLKLAPATEQFQHFVSNLRELSGRPERAHAGGVAEVLLKRIPSGKEIALRWWMLTSGMTNSGVLIATVITREIL